MKKKFSINKSGRGLHRCLVVAHSASPPNPLAQIALFFHFTASCFILRGSLLHSARLCQEKRRKKRKKTTKADEGIKGKGMIYIKHNCYHFTFHQVSSCWCESGCPTSLLFLSDLIKKIVLPSSSEGSRLCVHILIVVIRQCPFGGYLSFHIPAV